MESYMSLCAYIDHKSFYSLEAHLQRENVSNKYYRKKEFSLNCKVSEIIGQKIYNEIKLELAYSAVNHGDLSRTAIQTNTEQIFYPL
jgi:hypothetical protein